MLLFSLFSSLILSPVCSFCLLILSHTILHSPTQKHTNINTQTRKQDLQTHEFAKTHPQAQMSARGVNIHAVFSDEAVLALATKVTRTHTYAHKIHTHLRRYTHTHTHTHIHAHTHTHTHIHTHTHTHTYIHTHTHTHTHTHKHTPHTQTHTHSLTP
jgi:hypothetical protein